MTVVERIRRIALLFQLKVQFACQFSIFVCVDRILIAIPVGTLEAGKLRARVNSVKSRVPPPRCEWIDHFATAIRSCHR